jgi:glucan phosphorylase
VKIIVEIAEEVDEEQCFLFGHLTPDVDQVRYLNQYQPMSLQDRSPELTKVSRLGLAKKKGILIDSTLTRSTRCSRR